MLDATVRRWIDPALDRAGRWLARRGVGADAVTQAGLALGLGAAGLIALGAFGWALALLLASRLADGLDGAVARATRPSDFGGLLDICADFLFYGAVPLGFVAFDPAANALPGAALLLAFYFNGATFLGFATLVAKRGVDPGSGTHKALYYSVGVMEGTETILIFVALCLWPEAFPAVALAFAAACFVTAILRLRLAAQVFGAAPTER